MSFDFRFLVNEYSAISAIRSEISISHVNFALIFVLMCSILLFVEFARLKTKSAGASKRTSKKAGKDPNKPKRPASAFFVFMYGQRFSL